MIIKSLMKLNNWIDRQRELPKAAPWWLATVAVQRQLLLRLQMQKKGHVSFLSVEYVRYSCHLCLGVRLDDEASNSFECLMLKSLVCSKEQRNKEFF